MDTQSLRIAITQGDSNGVGYELIFRAFSEEEMLELCTPIIYGSAKVAAYHMKVLDLKCPYTIIKSIDEVEDGRVNFLSCFDEDIRVSFGQRTPESVVPALQALSRAAHDCRTGDVQALVCGPIDDRVIPLSATEVMHVGKYTRQLLGTTATSLTIYQNGITRVIVANEGMTKAAIESLNKTSLVSKVKTLHATLQRDYLIDTPRIAILAVNVCDGAEETDILLPAVKTLVDSGIHVFGPYRSYHLFGSQDYKSFDAIVAMHTDQAWLALEPFTMNAAVTIVTGLPYVCTMPSCDAQMAVAGRGDIDPMPMRNAIYAAIDAVRRRADYDEARESPLPKLYKDRADAGEKQYVPTKKREETESEVSDGQ